MKWLKCDYTAKFTNFFAGSLDITYMLCGRIVIIILHLLTMHISMHIYCLHLYLWNAKMVNPITIIAQKCYLYLLLFLPNEVIMMSANFVRWYSLSKCRICLFHSCKYAQHCIALSIVLFRAKYVPDNAKECVFSSIHIIYYTCW